MVERLSWRMRMLLPFCLVSVAICIAGTARAQPVIDEARQAGRSAQSFPAADEDYFRAMDGGIALTPDEVNAKSALVPVPPAH